MKTHVGLIFWLRTDKVNAQGLAPVSCRLAVRGKHSDLSTGVKVAPAEWGGTHRRVIGRSEAAKRHNSYLLQMQVELENLIADLDRQGKLVTAQNLAHRYRTPAVTGQTLLQLYEAFLAERSTLVGVELAKDTTKANRTSYTRLKDFLAANRLTALLPEEVTHSLADKLLHWGLQQRGFKRGTANKQVRRLSQVLTWGVRRDFIEKNPLLLYRCKEEAAGEIKYLTAGQVAGLSHLPLPANLTAARDCFLFQCWTGLAYADLAQLDLTSAEYHTDKTGKVVRVLRGRRAKSTVIHGFEYVIPLLPEAERILALYSDRLPVPTNQAYNRLLKQVGAAAGLAAEKCTSHVGRKTAGVMMLNMGIRMETVSKFLGHSSVKITEKLYAKILDTTVIEDFGRVFSAVGTAAHQLPPSPNSGCLVAIEPDAATPWRRPTPVTSHDEPAPSPGGRLVPMWSTPNSGKEAVCA